MQIQAEVDKSRHSLVADAFNSANAPMPAPAPALSPAMPAAPDNFT